MNSEKVNGLVQFVKQIRKNQIQQYYKYNNICYKIEIIRYSNVTNTIVYVTKQKCICKKIVVTLPPKFEKTLIGIKKVRGGT